MTTLKILSRDACKAILWLAVASLLLNSSSASQAESTDFRETKAKAAEGDVKAQYNLGRIYAEGDGVRQSYKKAFGWYHKAAAQDYALAKNKLGVMYERGLGVKRDYVKAYRWFTSAAGTNQAVYAIANREALARRMTAGQIVEGERRAAMDQFPKLTGLR
jgi:uncharacterized protein